MKHYTSITDFRVGHGVFTTKRHASACRVHTTELIVPVPDAVPSHTASLAYFAQLGLAALRQAHYEPGESLAVVSLGVIGLCTAAVGRALGAKVVGVGNSNIRLAVAAQVGARATVCDLLDDPLTRKIRGHLRSDK
jgi:threonine dehydrogenase-like Zn-dependent dehydrogenase